MDRGAELCHIEVLGGQLDHVSIRKAGEPKPIVRLYTQSNKQHSNTKCEWVMFFISISVAALLSCGHFYFSELECFWMFYTS